MTDSIRGVFPALRDDYRKTSPQDVAYNCIAWAAKDTARWWWPVHGYWWPVGAPANRSVSAFIVAFGRLGYQSCSNGSLEEGFEKVAIYADSSGDVQHMARQLPDTGRWTSKLGIAEDIQHTTPAELEGDCYGAVVQYMRRPIP